MSQPILIDARGHKCPVPSLKLRKAMEGQGPGVRLCLLASDPMARIDVPYLMQDLGGQVVEIETVSDGLRITVETGGAQPD
jgi:tRNA 2-thiouridine synthesizing protein A